MQKYEYLTHQDMNNYYSEVVRQMAYIGYIPNVVLAPMRGGADFGIKISNYYKIPFEPFTWQTRDGDEKNEEQLVAILEKHKGKRILIVDDILDSGETIKDVMGAALKHGEQPLVAVAIENVECNVIVDFSGREISRSEEPQWFVFPWEDWWKRKS